jgi:hypothetical protein
VKNRRNWSFGIRRDVEADRVGLPDLTVFVAVADHLSIRAVANHLGTTPDVLNAEQALANARVRA